MDVLEIELIIFKIGFGMFAKRRIIKKEIKSNYRIHLSIRKKGEKSWTG